LKVHQITEAGILDGVLGKVRDLVDPTANRPQTANSVRPSNTGNNPSTASTGSALPGELTQGLNDMYRSIDRAVQAGNKNDLLAFITAGPYQILQRSGRQAQIATDQHLRDSFERRLRREIIKHMATNHIAASRLPGTARNDWYAFGRGNAERFVDIVLNPALASELR
jgi:hypothetical protein